MSQETYSLEYGIEGVFETHQERSRKSRDEFIEAGFVLLNQTRFADLKVSDITTHCGRSVGSFYKRFEDKEAFFRAMQVAAVTRNRKIFARRLAPERLSEMRPSEVLDALVDTLSDIFSSTVRGVLRESLLRIFNPVDGWAPMRASGRDIQDRIVERLKSEYPGQSESETERKLRFCYQTIVGVLQNDLVNDFHLFSTRDQSIRPALKAIVRDHMSSVSLY